MYCHFSCSDTEPVDLIKWQLMSGTDVRTLIIVTEELDDISYCTDFRYHLRPIIRLMAFLWCTFSPPPDIATPTHIVWMCVGICQGN